MPLLTDIRKAFFVLYPSPDVGWSNVWTIIYCVCNWDSVSRIIGVVQVRSEEESPKYRKQWRQTKCRRRWLKWVNANALGIQKWIFYVLDRKTMNQTWLNMIRNLYSSYYLVWVFSVSRMHERKWLNRLSFLGISNSNSYNLAVAYMRNGVEWQDARRRSRDSKHNNQRHTTVDELRSLSIGECKPKLKLPN